MVIAADNDKATEGQEPGRNPDLIKGQLAAEGAGAVPMAPPFSEEEVQAGFTDWNARVSFRLIVKPGAVREVIVR
jgi:hypothetical protein